MRISHVIVAAVLSMAVLCTLAACGEARQVDSVVPTNIKELQAKEPGKSLKKYGYTPVAYLFNHDEDSKIFGEIYVDCGATANLTECHYDKHNRGTYERPNVYVVGGDVVVLEGPHASDTDDRSYYVAVPKDDKDQNYRDFAALGDEDQKKLLGIMPTIAKAIGQPSDREAFSVRTSIGLVNAWVSSLAPRFAR